ncbi:hypothetical protein B0H21DRAFT_883455, partial [Amylocystis lapponica]
MPSGSHEELTRAYTGLLQAVSTLQATGAQKGEDPTARAEDPTYRAKDSAAGVEGGTAVNASATTKSRYGQAKFTTREKFMAWLKGARGASEINVARKEGGEGQEGGDDDSGSRQCCYLEDDQGCTIPRARIDRMRDHARAIWNLFAENNRAPSTWSQAPLDVRNEFRTEMVSRFPELRLCEDDWKTDYLAMKNYPHWHKRRYPKTPVIKDEHQVHGPDLEDLAEPTAKKVKVAGTESTHDGIATVVVVDEGEGPDLMLFDTITPEKAKVPGTEPTLQNGIAAHPVVDKGKRPALVLKNALSGLFKVSSPGVDTGPLPDEPTGAGNSDTPGILTSDTIDSTPTASSVDVPAPQMDGRIDVPPTCEPKTPPDALLPATSTSSVKQSPEQPTTKSGSAKAGATNVKVYKPLLSTTARNLCGIEWKKKNPTGTTEDFANYYNGLLPGARKGKPPPNSLHRGTTRCPKSRTRKKSTPRCLKVTAHWPAWLRQRRRLQRRRWAALWACLRGWVYRIERDVSTRYGGKQHRGGTSSRRRGAAGGCASSGRRGAASGGGGVRCGTI